MMAVVIQLMWHIEMFGGLRMSQSDHVITRFKNTKNGALLAYLAFHRGKPRFRTVVIDLLWPEIELEAGRNSLRVALNSLRHQLEPPGIATGTILLADRMQIGLNAEAVTTDVAEFEAALREEQRNEQDPEQRKQWLIKATQLYTGDFLPGWYEEWTEPERVRLADMYIGALRRLTRMYVESREYDRAIECARLAVNTDPYREDAYRHLIELYAITGRPAMALQQYAELERILRDSLGVRPSAAISELAAKIQEKTGIRQGAANALSREIIERESERDSAPLRQVYAPNPLPQDPKRAGLPGALLPTSRFFGREQEIEQICSMLHPGGESDEPVRLVTLTGPGGCGKTRLAMECGRRLSSLYQDHIWFASLANTLQVDSIVDTIAASILPQRIVEMEPLEQIVSALSPLPSLLVLDNFEQLAEDGASVIEALLMRMPELRCLVTSQLRLGISGVYDMALAPLPVPEDDTAPALLLECPSAALFIDRAQQARPDFQVTARNGAAIAALVRGMEGMPLAIELAAAWAQVLTPAQMLERLGDRFQLLVHPRKGKVDRHQALNRTIEWSYGLLTEEQRAFLTGVSIFRGGWTDEAATEICGKGNASLLLWQLCERSLVISEETERGMRFRMLSSIREFAAEKASAETTEQLVQAHADWYLQFAEQAAQEIGYCSSAHWSQRFTAERDNLDAALDRLLARNDGLTALRLATDLWRFWYRSGNLSEGRQRLSAALAIATNAPIGLRARSLYAAGRLAATQGDQIDSKLLFQESLRLAHEALDSVTARAARTALGLTARTLGDYELAMNLCTEAVEDYRSNGDFLEEAQSLADRAIIAGTLGNSELAIAYNQDAIEARRKLHWPGSDSETVLEIGISSIIPEDMTAHLVTSFLSLGILASEQGDYADARALTEDGIAMLDADSSEFLEAIAREHLAHVALRQHDWQTAHTCLKRALTIRMDSSHDTTGLARCVFDYARIAAGRHQYQIAAALLGAVSGPLNLSNLGRNSSLGALLSQEMGEALQPGLLAGTSMSLEIAAAKAVAEVAGDIQKA